MRMWLVTGLLVVSIAGLSTARLTGFEQAARVVTDDDWCENAGGDSERATYCEVRELTLSGSSALRIEDSPNGSISVTGSSRSDIQVRARVVGRADTEDEARSLAGQVRVTAEGDRVRTSGPRTDRGESWNVSYRAAVPMRTDLDLGTANGSISVTDVQGAIGVESKNGSIRMTGVGGTVSGETSNGSVSVTLTGSSWDGDGLDIRTSNGSVGIEIPENYNARLVAATRNGGLRSDVPVTQQGRRRSREVDTTLGNGGATIRVTSSNGSVRIRQGSN